MKSEILLAQLKAFQIYLKNHIEDVKSRPEVELNKKGKLPVDEHNANVYEDSHISSRYKKLKVVLEQQYPDVFYMKLKNNFDEGIRGLQFMYREIGFVLDTISNLDVVSPNHSGKSQTNNQPFNENEVLIINSQLDDLQTKLIETLNKQNLSQEKIIPLIETVKIEISDLKAEATNTKLGRKDWKNHLVNTMVTLTFTLSFSQEARNTIFIYFHGLLTFLQQHIFLLKP